MSDDYVYGICPDCGHAYTEPIEDFANWLPPGCPRCSSKAAPYPVTDDELPLSPPLLPLTPSQAIVAPKDWLLLLLLRDLGYRLGMWVGYPPSSAEQEPWRNFAVGGNAGSFAVEKATIAAAWRIGERESGR